MGVGVRHLGAKMAAVVESGLCVILFAEDDCRESPAAISDGAIGRG